MDRVILHCDLNNFYASVECLYNPQIRNFPVAVCGSQELRHGIVLAKNYKAKDCGVKTGMPIWQAKQKCPDIIIVPPNYSRYLRFSQSARNIYKDYTDLIEAFGIDECWLDITGSIKKYGDGEAAAYAIKNRIRDELGITASVGVSYNKIFAKLGSDMKKPDAVTVITKENFKNKIWGLPVEDLLYVGHSTKKKLNKIGIYTIGNLANIELHFIKNHLGKWGETLWLFANGYDNCPVSNVGQESAVKGVGNSLTTPKDLACPDEVKMLIYVLAESVGERLRRYNLKGKTVQISIKDCELAYIERQAQLESPTYVNADIAKCAYQIFLAHWNWEKNIRALGIRVTNLVAGDHYTQLSIFGDKKEKLERLEKCIDGIRKRFGHYSLQRAIMIKDKGLNANPIEENIIHPIPYFK